MIKISDLDVFDNIEYLHIVRGNNTLLTFDNSFSGKKKSEFQAIIGNTLGEGRYNYSLKFLDNGKIYKGTIRGFSTKTKTNKELDLMDNQVLLNLQSQIDNISKKSNDVDIDKILKLQDSLHNRHIAILETEIKKLEKENDKLKKATDSETGNNDMLGSLLTPILAKFLTKGQNMSSNLNDKIDSDSIPNEVLAVLQRIDYNKLDNQTIINLSSQLDKLIDLANLPRK